jgi:hypothetical protein
VSTASVRMARAADQCQGMKHAIDVARPIRAGEKYTSVVYRPGEPPFYSTAWTTLKLCADCRPITEQDPS